MGRCDTKYGKEGYWMTKGETTPYGVSVRRSIRNLWWNFSEKLRYNVKDGRKTLSWEDFWLENGKLKQLFPDLFGISLQRSELYR